MWRCSGIWAEFELNDFHVVILHAAGRHYNRQVDEESTIRRQTGDVGRLRHERHSAGESRRPDGHRTAGQLSTRA